MFMSGLFGAHTDDQGVSARATTSAQEAASGTAAGQAPAHASADNGNAGGAGPVSTHYAELDLSSIPLGDGMVSAGAKVGYVYSCQTTFTGGGAEHAGDWIHGSTWNLNEKIHVEGENYWSNASFSNIVSGAYRMLTGNGLPVDEPTGNFPIARTDPAWQIDKNPNAVGVQHDSYQLPANPSFAAAPSCVPMGAIGMALDGVAIYNALDEAGRDAVAHEVQDSCDGHPQGAEEYHYHGPSPCMPNIDKENTVIGYAFDGFPITSLYDAHGHYYADADLDACHGTTGAYTDESGVAKSGYHYVLTWEYPYTIGCFKGTPVSAHSGGGTQQGGGQGGPPQAAITACSGKSSSASCSFTAPQGTISGTCRTTQDGSLACVPQ